EDRPASRWWSGGFVWPLIYRISACCGGGSQKPFKTRLASAQFLHFLLTQFLRTAFDNALSPLNQGAAVVRVRRGDGDVTEGTHHSQAHCDIRLRIQANLLERRVQHAPEVAPHNADARHAGRITKQRRRRLPGGKANQDAAELVHAGNRRAGVVDGRGDGLERNVHDLQNTELHVLLQGSRGAEVERVAKL